MTKFISNTKNPYGLQSGDEKKGQVKGQFVSKSKVEAIRPFKNNTAITGRKVLFKHV